ncbi:Uncharacterized protein OBRU01_16400 [Operophtera brumata]|uniref:FLYWCH-type domain-containing protein n=1 Tax=Operophtera brumata TaxID=104452 RepID=A0A0L7L2P4_OPEBR|nr:Uncharacterized protein OBRU01_16400 [Operophtera brumata]
MLFKQDDAVFTKSRRGQPMIHISGYRFRKHLLVRLKTYWRCSTHQPQGCRAVIHTVQDKSRTRITKYVIFTYTSRNQPRIIIGGHPFCKHIDKGPKIYWQCSAHRGCRAKLHTLPDNTIIKCHNVHNH